jgi:hypothetical protein
LMRPAVMRFGGVGFLWRVRSWFSVNRVRQRGRRRGSDSACRAALIGYFVVNPDSANLWPLSLIAGTVVGVPPAFAGAYFGKLLTTISKQS